MFLHLSVILFTGGGGGGGGEYLGRYTLLAGTLLWKVHPRQVHPPGQVHPRHSACWDTVNTRAVRIPVECILVTNATLRGKMSTGEPVYVIFERRGAIAPLRASKSLIFATEIQQICAQLLLRLTKYESD